MTKGKTLHDDDDDDDDGRRSLTHTDEDEKDFEDNSKHRNTCLCRNGDSSQIDKLSRKSIYILPIIISLVINAIFIAVNAYFYHSIVTLEIQQKHEDDKSHYIYLPCYEEGTYCRNHSTVAMENLITLLYTEFKGKRNFSLDPVDRDDNRPVLKQKSAEMYYADADAIKSTSGNLQLYEMKYSRNSQTNQKKAITISSDGLYMLFVTLQYCFHSNIPTYEKVSTIIHRRGEEAETDSIIYHSSVPYRTGPQTFVPDTCLLPIRLKQNDTLSLYVTGISHLHDMRISNVFGFQEITKDSSS